VWFVFHVVLQTNGATPLFVASQNGHVECVRALLSGGAAINQAMVGCASSRARHVVVLGRVIVRARIVVCSGMSRRRGG
jgi:hypothetical protein